MTTNTLPLWIEIIVAILLLASAVLTLGASWGLVRMRTFVQRMHPPPQPAKRLMRLQQRQRGQPAHDQHDIGLRALDQRGQRG